MVQLTFATVMALALTVIAAPQPITPDPSGDKNVGLGNGQQFITGACKSGADCRSDACCARIVGDDSIGICSGLKVGDVAGKAGCGFGDGGATPAPSTTGGNNAANNNVAAPADGASQQQPPSAGQCPAPDTNLPGSQNVGLGNAAQFITGQCFSKADCASNCCVQQASGPALCKAQLLTQQTGLSCDFTCAA